MKYTCMRADWRDATFIISGWSVSSIIRFMPDRRMTSCKLLRLVLMLPHSGVKTLISLTWSCIDWGRLRLAVPIGDSGTNGVIS